MLTPDALVQQLDRQSDRLIEAMRRELGPDEVMRARMSVEHAGQLATVKAELATAKAELAETTDRLDRMRLRGPAARGAAFEQYVAESLTHYLPHLAVTDVSKLPNSMDLAVELPRPGGDGAADSRPLRVGIDAKDRASTPTLAELSRFVSDMERYDGGVLVLRNRCAIQEGWRRVSDDLVSISPRAWIVTRLETNPGMLGCALTHITLACCQATGASVPVDAGSLNRLLRAVVGPLRETMQFVTKTKDAAAALLRHIGDKHASLLHAAAADAANDHPELQTVELTSLLHPAKRPRS